MITWYDFQIGVSPVAGAADVQGRLCVGILAFSAAGGSRAEGEEESNEGGQKRAVRAQKETKVDFQIDRYLSYLSYYYL